MRKYAGFLCKLVSLAVILAALGCYQSVAQQRAAEVAEREAAIAEVEAYNAAIRGDSGAGSWADGTYEGTGLGFGGDITVSVTVADGKITDIQVLSAAGEDPAYYNQALGVLEKIKSSQATQVDTMSGATYSSAGLIEAVSDALGKAVS